MAQAIIVRRGGKGSAPSYPYNVSGLSYTNTDASVTVKWTDPADAAWAGTLVLAKQGGYPSGPTDSSAITIVDSKVKNQYSSTGFTKTNLAAGAWYFQAYPYDGDGAVSNNVANRLAVTVTYIYPSALASFSITGGNAQATPVFTLPADAVSADLVYKTGSYPSSITDGTVIQNATSGTAVTSLTNDITYYFRAFPKNTYGRYNTATTGNQASVTPQALPAKDTLQNTSWANIALVAAAGKASEYWAVCELLNDNGSSYWNGYGRPTVFDNEPEKERDLMLGNPYMRGNDVLALQETLLFLGYDEVGDADGVYGPNTDKALRSFQDRAKGMTEGVCDAAMRDLLGL